MTAQFQLLQPVAMDLSPSVECSTKMQPDTSARRLDRALRAACNDY